MKRALLVAAATGLAAAPLRTGGKRVTGSYVEARTAEVFTGGGLGAKWSDKRPAFFGTFSY
jgi:hypothetical protein